MAAGAKRNDRRYRTPGVVDGNLARQLSSYELERRLEESGQVDFDQAYRRRELTEAEKLARRRAETKAAVRPAQKASPVVVLGFAAIGGLLIMLILCYVQINAISSNIVSMKQEISRLEADQISLRARHEQAFDTASVKEAAMAVGMGQPTDSQITYISLPGEDQTRSCKTEEAGILSRIFSALGDSVYAVVEYFR